MQSDYISPDMMEHVLAALMPANALAIRVSMETGYGLGMCWKSKRLKLKKAAGQFGKVRPVRRAVFGCQKRCKLMCCGNLVIYGHFPAVLMAGVIGRDRPSIRTLGALLRPFGFGSIFRPIPPAKCMLWRL